LYDLHTMEKHHYEILRALSQGLFKNGLVLPLSWAILDGVGLGDSFIGRDLREKLGGRSADNQIRGALARLEAIGAITELPYLGRPNPHTWVRAPHPFWDFATSWIEQSIGGVPSDATRS
jgi:hypothetical protein